jgi:hypothetical protein
MRELAQNWHILRTTRANFPASLFRMEAMRTRWSDERLDDLKLSIDDGFKEVKGSITRLDGRIDRLRQTMIVAVVAIRTVMFAGFGAVITLFATHF